MLDLQTAFATFPALETERLVLRAMTLADAEEVFRIMSDPRVMRYFGREPMKERAEAIRYVQGFATTFEQHTRVRWGITWRENGQFLGTCGFWRLIVEHDRAEIGYELAPEWWGRGIIPEAVAAALGFGFSTLGLHSVEAQIHPANIGSRRVLEKVGFVQEGYFRENYYDPAEGGFTDTAVFSLLKATWLQRVAT